MAEEKIARDLRLLDTVRGHLTVRATIAGSTSTLDKLPQSLPSNDRLPPIFERMKLIAPSTDVSAVNTTFRADLAIIQHQRGAGVEGTAPEIVTGTSAAERAIASGSLVCDALSAVASRKYAARFDTTYQREWNHNVSVSRAWRSSRCNHWVIGAIGTHHIVSAADS